MLGTENNSRNIITADDEIPDQAAVQLQDKLDWVREMRKQFCIRPEFPSTHEILLPDGSLNQA